MEYQKNVDENWKKSAADDKKKPVADEGAESSGNKAPEVDFVNYVTSLALQTIIFLGEVPNPVTNKTEQNLDQAKFLIDTLIMIREKTKGNLEEQEDAMLNTAIYELQTKYISLTHKGQQ